MAVAAVKWVMSKRTILKHLFPVQNSGVHVQMELYIVFVINLRILLYQMTIIAA
ncbi:MRPL42 isoform 7 [Pongo abelii]|uniref:MRPL42 isoform 7 n=1 Tax=Pongo abelii TaxID=9601 RepID=A0A2J8XN70_PONAB|nr:MRPL42 isoform 7 [Pongo abelii]